MLSRYVLHFLACKSFGSGGIIGGGMPESYLQLCAAIRKRPAMYFGNEPVARMFHEVVDALLSRAPLRYPGPVSVGVAGDSQVTIRCEGFVSPLFHPGKVEGWLSQMYGDHGPCWAVLATAALSEVFRVESSDG